MLIPRMIYPGGHRCRLVCHILHLETFPFEAICVFFTLSRYSSVSILPSSLRSQVSRHISLSDDRDGRSPVSRSIFQVKAMSIRHVTYPCGQRVKVVRLRTEMYSVGAMRVDFPPTLCSCTLDIFPKFIRAGPA